MRAYPYHWSLVLLLIALPAFGASYSINTNAAGETVLDEAQNTTHQGLTHVQILQRAVNAFLQQLAAQQSSQESSVLDEKLKVATPAAKNNARNALNAGITPPSIATIADRTQNVDQSAVVPIVVTNTYDGTLAIRVDATGLPPGIRVRSNAETGAPELQGTLTTAGAFVVTVRAYLSNMKDVFGQQIFSWQVNP